MTATAFTAAVKAASSSPAFKLLEELMPTDGHLEELMPTDVQPFEENSPTTPERDDSPTSIPDDTEKAQCTIRVLDLSQLLVIR